MPGFNNSATFKIFIGKIPEQTNAQDIRPLFEKYGNVLECDVVKNYGFVHMEDPKAGHEAIKYLNGAVVNGATITVEEAKNKKRSSTLPTTKIFVGNISESVKPSDIRALFSRYGNVAECDLVRNYGFVHIDTVDLTKLLKELNGYEIGGQQLKVQISTSRVRQRPGMGSPQQCYKCGHPGHWSKECTNLPKSTLPGQSTYLPDPMNMMPPQRATYTREMYQHTTASASFVRDRLINSYVPDPRGVQIMPEYYDPYTDYTQSAAMAAARGDAATVAAAAAYTTVPNQAPATAQYDMYGRRSPTMTNVSHYTDGRTYDEYSASAVPYTYPAKETWTGYGDYSTAVPVTLAAPVDPYGTATATDGRAAVTYEDYNAAMAYMDSRRTDRRM